MTAPAATWPISLDDPYEDYRRLRDTGPVVWLDEVGLPLVVSYAEARDVLHGDGWSSDPRNNPAFAALLADAGLGQDAALSSLLFSDPPEHTRLRNKLAGYFTPRRVDAFRDRIRSLVKTALDGHDVGVPFDVMGALAYAVPLAAICEILDVGPDVEELLRAQTPALAATLDPLVDSAGLEDGVVAGLSLLLDLVPVVAERRARPGNDLISELSGDRDGTPGLEPEEVIATALLLLVAGHETTAMLVGNSVVALHDRPQLIAALRRDPMLIAPAVSELLRFESPVQLAGRVAVADTTVGGIRVRAGQQVLIGLGAANRDPAAFIDPDSILLRRGGSPHLAFGHGRHFCVGAALARVETEEMLQGLIEAHPRLAAYDVDLQRAASAAFRRITRLSLTPDPGCA